jgi:S-adenosyl-L-methionine hydrolase (adenosine-forming)
MSFVPAGLIALTSDFGMRDPFAGIVKARILGRFPAARIVDLCHGMAAGRPDLAGFWLARCWLDFPPGTVHLAIVDPGVGTPRGVVLACAAGRLLLAPDNGLLPEALRHFAGTSWRSMDAELPARLGVGELSRTFHGRDLFAPLAAELASGALALEEFGPRASPADPAPVPAPTREDGGIVGRVVLADHYGNLFTNISAELVASCRQPSVELQDGRLLPLLTTYGEAPAGGACALINAFGLLELAINGGSAAAGLNLGEGAIVRLRDGLRT